ncbi:hypothetical protein DRW48_10545 [Paracoccus suum]|uniref:Uncharacterized protein n=1 Tax=Paracoccus suum TaxID=2259340 RepID=A0A344PL18_9RHOB|nr:hypothetical protein [Paracoccus suum]AXC50073.1 hypothetical protein DRW48_10545 [Paracoccus suum]
MAFTYTPPLPKGLGASPVQKGDQRAWFDQIRAAFDAGEFSSGKIFGSRQSAIDLGQDKLASNLRHIFVLEDGWMTLRSAGSSSADPLFGTFPNWGVVDRWPAANALSTILRNVGMVNLVNVTGMVVGTSASIKGDFPADVAQLTGDGITANMQIGFVSPVTTTTGDVTLTIGSDARNLRQENGDYFNENVGLKAYLFYAFRRASDGWRMIYGGVTAKEVIDRVAAGVSAEATARVASVVAEAEERRKIIPALATRITRLSGQRGNRIIASDASGKPVVAATPTGELEAFLSEFTRTLRSKRRRGSLTDFLTDGAGLPVMSVTASGDPVFRLLPDVLGARFNQSRRRRGTATVIAYRAEDEKPLLWIDTKFRTAWDGETTPGTPPANTPASGHTGTNGTWPDVDAWDLAVSGSVTRYSSPQLRGETRRYAVTPATKISIAESDGTVMGILGVGQPWAAESSGDNPWPWHVLGLSGSDIAPVSTLALPQTVAAAALEKAWRARARMPAYVADALSMTASVSTWQGPTVTNWLTAFKNAVAKYGEAAALRYAVLTFGASDKTGVPGSLAQSMSAFVKWLGEQAASITGQTAAMYALYTQFSGTRTDGAYQGTLAAAEAWRLDPTVEMWPVTPLYPYALAAGSPHAPGAAGLKAIAGHMVLAAEATAKLGQYYAPTPTLARLEADGRVRVDFDAMSKLRSVNYGASVDVAGFAVEGATVTDVTIAAKSAFLTVSGTVTAGSSYVTYAWGQAGDKGDGFTAARGTICDGYSAVNPLDSTQTLTRYALSGRLQIT